MKHFLPPRYRHNSIHLNTPPAIMKRIHPSILLTSIASLLTAHSGYAADATFSSGAFTGDADSGVSSTKTYVALGNVLGGNVTVNGATFLGTGTSGAGWSLSGAGDAFGGGGIMQPLGGAAIANLFDAFQYGGPGTVTFSNLTAGQTYVATFYNQAWGLGANRTQGITSADGANYIYNEDALAASTLRYTFVATGASTSVTMTAKNPGSNFHYYGLSNEQVFTNTWTPAVDSTWETAGNWTGGTPNSAGSNASFSAQAGATAVSVTGAKTVGHVQFLGTGSYTVSGASTVTLQADTGGTSVLKADAGGSHTIAAPVQINSPLAKYGAGTVKLAGTVTGSGQGVTIGSGTLAIESSSGDLSSLGNIANSGTLALTNAAAQQLDTVISGSGGFSKSGAGTLTLGGYQTYSGPTVISNGLLKLATTTAIAIGNPSFETFDPLANGSFGYSPTGASWSFNGAGIALNGSPWFNPTNHDGNAGGFIQGTSISQTVTVPSDGFYNFGFQGVSRGGGNGPTGLIFKVDGIAVKTFDPSEFSDASWANYTASVSLTGGSHMISFEANNLLGGDRSTVIDSVTGVTGGRLPSNTAVSLTNSGAALDLSAQLQTVGSLAGVAGTSVINGGSLTTGADGASTTFAGVLSGPGSFTKAGSGTMTLSGANSYGGSTTISGGTLALTGGTISSGALSLSGAGATLNSGGTGISVASLSGIAGTTVALGGGALTVGDATTTTFAGSLTSGSLTKQGNGSLTLSGALSVTGDLNVAGGTLKTVQSNSGSIANLNVAGTWDLGLGSHTVASGLSGNGNIIRSGVIFTGLDGAAQISTSKNYVQKLDFGDGAAATVNGVAFTLANNNGPGHTLAGAGALFGGGDVGGYDQLINDFYYNGSPGVLSFSNLNVGQTYEAMLYTKVGAWTGRPQDATFDEDGAGPVANQLLGTDPGNVGYYAYRFVAHQSSMSISMQPNIGHTFHWFGASLESVSTAQQTLTFGDAGAYGFGGAINGPTKLVKQGTGVQALYGASNYSGGTDITAGSIFGYHSTALGSGPVSVANNANYAAWWNGSSRVINNSFTLNGMGGDPGGGNKDAIYADGGGAGHSEYLIKGNVTLAATSNIGGHNTNNLRIDGQITGPGGLTKGAGRVDENNTLILANPANNYAGNTNITVGTVKLAAAEVIPHGAGKGSVSVSAGATLDLAGNNETINNLSGGGTVTSSPGVFIGAPVNFNSDAGTGISAAKTYTHALDFTEGTDVAINGVNFTGAGTSGANWDLAGAPFTAGNGSTAATGDISRLLTNFYYGGNPATLTLSGLTAGTNYETRLYARQWGGNRTQLFNFNSGTASNSTFFDSDVSGSASYMSFRYTAAATGTATLTTHMIGDGTYHWYGLSNEVVAAPATTALTVGDATNSTFSGSMTGPIALTKTGAGSLELSGTNSNTGATTINGGKLLVNGTLGNTSAVAVNTGILAGSGSINSSANVTVGVDGEISPGNSIGTLSLGPVAFADGSALTIEVGVSTADQLIVAGAGSIAGTVALGLSLLDDPTDNTTFTLLDGTNPFAGYASGGRFSVSGNSLDEGELFTVTTGPYSQEFSISYASDSGNDVTLHATPEPGSAALLLLGTALLARRRRRE